jgi:hypothetical protein
VFECVSLLRFKESGLLADSIVMEPEMKSALWKAGAKLGIGLTLVAAVVGFRMITVTPEGVPAAIEKLEELDSQIAAEAAENDAADAALAKGGDDSFVARFGTGVREHLSGSDSDSRDGERLVSCRLSGRTQFMRADDCAVRGGESTLLSDDR